MTRKADQAYVPPGRLRHYDLIILDKVSQIDAGVWAQLKTALAELSPCPYVVFVGNFQQLQPVHGCAQDLDMAHGAGRLRRVELSQHAAGLRTRSCLAS